MAYFYELVAISYDHNNGGYVIESKSETEILDLDRKLLNDISSDSFYLDQAIVVAKKNFADHISMNDNKTKNWYLKLTESVALIMIVSREWETGLS